MVSRGAGAGERGILPASCRTPYQNCSNHARPRMVQFCSLSCSLALCRSASAGCRGFPHRHNPWHFVRMHAQPPPKRWWRVLRMDRLRQVLQPPAHTSHQKQVQRTIFPGAQVRHVLKTAIKYGSRPKRTPRQPGTNPQAPVRDYNHATKHHLCTLTPIS